MVLAFFSARRPLRTPENGDVEFMKLLFIRHGEPDYSIDSLTPKGWREAELLADRLEKLNVRQFYCSPLGRAKDTARETLRRAKREAVICGWLQEFPAQIADPVTGNPRIPWDLLPEFWTVRTDLYDKDRWFDDPIMRAGGVREAYDRVSAGLDAVLAENGYRRSGMFYRAEQPNSDTLVFFCHLGVQCVMLSHLLGVSAPVLWQGVFLAPTSVTTVATEERAKGAAYFRCRTVGDTAHLDAAGEPISVYGRYPQTFQK